MSVNVYFANIKARNPHQNKISKIQKLFEKAGLKLIKMKDDFPFRLVEFILQF